MPLFGIVSLPPDSLNIPAILIQLRRRICSIYLVCIMYHPPLHRRANKFNTKGWMRKKAQWNACGGGGVNLSASRVLWVNNTRSWSTSLMISSLYNREDGVKPGHCVATANEPNTICPSASALGEDEFGCVPCVAIGGRPVNGWGKGKSDDVR